MRYQVKDGIMFDDKISILDDNNSSIPFYMSIYQLLAIILGVWSVSGVLIDGLIMPVTTRNVYLAIFIFGIVSFLLFQWQSYVLLKIGIGVLLYGIGIRYYIDEIINAFFIIENLVIDQINSYYHLTIPRYVADYSSANKDITIFMILLISMLTLLMSAAIVNNKLKNTCYIIMMLPFAASFAIGRIPSEWKLVTYLIVTIFLLKAHDDKHMVSKEQKQILNNISSRVALWLSALALGIFLLSKVLFSPNQYQELERLHEARTSFQTFLYEFNINDVFNNSRGNFLSNSQEFPGGLNGGELGRVEEVKYLESEQLKLYAPWLSVMTGLYLKGYVGSIYTGDSWSGLTISMQSEYGDLLKKISLNRFPVVNQSNTLLKHITGDLNKFDLKMGRILIEYRHANRKFLYAPYHTNYELLDVTYIHDLYAAPLNREQSYNIEYFYNVSLYDNVSVLELGRTSEGLIEYFEYEKLYRDYVYSVYTMLPVRGVDRVIEDFSSQEIAVTGNLLDKITFVKDYLKTNTEYTLAPGKLPKDKDFVEYFLYENKLGYCAHYASAATVMLRAMGVPARYVEGYLVTSSDILLERELKRKEEITDTRNVNVLVKDSNAHAWIEVYIDGMGWFPVEVTPGNNTVQTDLTLQEMFQISEGLEENKDGNEITQDQEPNNQEDPEDKDKEEEQAANIPTPAVQDPIEEPDKVEDAIKQIPEQEQNPLSAARYMIGFILSIIVLGISKYLMKQLQFKHTSKSHSYSKKALLLYREIEKLLIACKGIPKDLNHMDNITHYIDKNCPYVKKEDFANCIEIVYKARFNKSTISLMELKTVEQFLESLRTQVYQKASLSKRLYFKLLLGLLS